MHTPPEQNLPPGQSASTLQPFAQIFPVASQAFGVQSWSSSGPHEPLPWQELASVATPLVQAAGRQFTLAPP
jgi:hypothetical protein